jgi:DNA-binding response OmpR family regulator
VNTKPLNKGTACVLIVCNEASTAPVWGYMIREKKLHAIIETMPKNAEKCCVEKAPALIILDLQLPPLKILDICHKLRGTCENPILLFLPSYDENLILEYYDAGIDDCVVKPISPVVFYAKVRAWLRHSKRLPVDAMLEVQVGDICLSPDQNLLTMDNGKLVKLTGLEVRFLYLLMSSPDQVFDGDSIVNQVWGLYGEQDASLIKHVVYRLRRKMEDNPGNPRWIQTWHGKGYSFRTS